MDQRPDRFVAQRLQNNLTQQRALIPSLRCHSENLRHLYRLHASGRQLFIDLRHCQDDLLHCRQAPGPHEVDEDNAIGISTALRFQLQLLHLNDLVQTVSDVDSVLVELIDSFVDNFHRRLVEVNDQNVLAFAVLELRLKRLLPDLVFARLQVFGRHNWYFSEKGL